jgi:hypothetical protein
MTDPSILSNAALNRRVAELLGIEVWDTPHGLYRARSTEHGAIYCVYSPSESIADAEPLLRDMRDDCNPLAILFDQDGICIEGGDTGKTLSNVDDPDALARVITKAWVRWKEGKE